MNPASSQIPPSRSTGCDPVSILADRVVAHIDPDVLETLSADQLAAIRAAVRTARPLGRHGVDIRVLVPLYFSRYYLVLQAGRDRRSATRRVEERRQRGAALVGGGLALATVLSPLVLVGLLGLYLAKSALGIDLFEDWHLVDLFR
ncbi:MAG: hypothetical protein AB1505_11440 [Candidatus Latescibacterota bacterium]